MDWNQLTERCPSAVFLHAARLENHRLAFTRWSTKRSCGVLDFVHEPNDTVWGGIFEIAQSDVVRLDAAEFVHGNGYRRVFVRVAHGPPDRIQRVRALAYEVVKKHSEPLLPSRNYMHHVLTGAEMCELPADYLAQLRDIDCLD